jgi:hypothetical protein
MNNEYLWNTPNVNRLIGEHHIVIALANPWIVPVEGLRALVKLDAIFQRERSPSSTFSLHHAFTTVKFPTENLWKKFQNQSINQSRYIRDCDEIQNVNSESEVKMKQKQEIA